MLPKSKNETAGQLFKTLLAAAGDPHVYDTVVGQIIAKFGSDKGFIKAVVDETGIPEEVVTKEIVDAASLPSKDTSGGNTHSNKDRQAANPNAPAPVKPPEAPQMPTQAPGLGTPPPAAQTPPIAQPQSAAPPAPMQAAAAQNQAKGMSPGQALNVANQAPKPMMKKGGLITKMEYGGSPSGGADPKANMSTIGLQDGGDLNEIDLMGKHQPGMLAGGTIDKDAYDDNGLRRSPKDILRIKKSKVYNDDQPLDREGISGTKDDMFEAGRDIMPQIKNKSDEDILDKLHGRTKLLTGGLMNLPSYNNSVEMKEGGNVPAGSLPEEVADDQPVMLSKGEFVIPANVVRYVGLEFLIKLRDRALEGLSKMEEAGQIRRPGDGKNPGEDGEVEPKSILGDINTIHDSLDEDPKQLLINHAIEEIEEHTELLEDALDAEDPDDIYMKSGGSLANPKEGSTLALKTAHLRHNKSYGHNSDVNNLNAGINGAGPNVAMAKGGNIPPDNTTGIDPNPSAFRNSATPEGKIGRNMGKRPFADAKGSASVEGKGVFRPLEASRHMAGGGDVDIEAAGKYLNSLDQDADPDSHRDTLPSYDNFRDFANAVASTPSIFGPGMIIDAIRGNGMFNNNYNPDYLTVGEAKTGQTAMNKSLELAGDDMPSYDDAKNTENNKSIMESMGGQSTEGTDEEAGQSSGQG